MITEQVYPVPQTVSHTYGGPQCSAYKTFSELRNPHPVHRDHGSQLPLHKGAIPSDRSVWALLRPRHYPYGHNRRFHRFRWHKSDTENLARDDSTLR